MRLFHRPRLARGTPRYHRGQRRSASGADNEVIALAIAESRVLLTEDKDFGQLYFASSATSPGVILIRYPSPVRKSMPGLVVNFVAANSSKITGRFTVIQPGRIRISD